MKILVTGHMGFVGSHLMDRLDNALGVDRKDGNDISVVGQLVTFAQFNSFKPDLVVHLAASCSTPRSITNPRQDFDDNVRGAFEVLEACRYFKCPIIFTSSCKAWTGTPYGTSKAVGEMYVAEYSQTYGIDNIINRPGTIYGPRQESSAESGWLGWFIKASLTGQPITIYGNGGQSRDVLYVDDYIDLLITQIRYFDKYSGHTYDIGGGENNEITLLEALDILEYRNYFFEKARIGDMYRFVADNDIDGWEPKTNYKDGIAKTIKYYKDIL